MTMNELETNPDELELFRKKMSVRIRHIRNVQDAAQLLAERLAEQGQFDLARRLVQKTLMHDSSKFEGIEWDYLDNDASDPEQKEKLFLAVHAHQQANNHHPEYFTNGIEDMSDVQLAEMICDWKARSQEFGSALVDWVKTTASVKYGFTLRSKTWKRIKYFLDLLLDPAIG